MKLPNPLLENSMTTSKRIESKAEQIIIDGFIKDLENTAEQVQKLLEEIRDSKISVVSIKSEVKFLIETVKELSYIIRDGNGAKSILTRLALIEKTIEDIKNYIEKDSYNGSAIEMRVLLLEQKIETLISYIESKKKEEDNNNKITVINSAGKWKLYVAIATGIFTLIGSIIAIILGSL